MIEDPVLRSVLLYELDSADRYVARFSRDLDEVPKTPRRTAWLVIERGRWEDMDKPERLTVTIEPGDLLNDLALAEERRRILDD
jgi:hypothetical protein